MIDNDNTTTSTSFDRSSTLSSSNSLMLGRQKPSIPPTASDDQRHPFLSNPSMSLTSHSEDSNNMRRGDMSQFQQLDEVSALSSLLTYSFNISIHRSSTSSCLKRAIHLLQRCFLRPPRRCLAMRLI